MASGMTGLPLDDVLPLPLPLALGVPVGGCSVLHEKVAVEPAERGAGSGEPLLRLPDLCNFLLHRTTYRQRVILG